MFRGLLIVALGSLLVACDEAGGADTEKDPRTFYGPDQQIVMPVADVEYQAGPDSLSEGAEYAVLEGDPSESGLFVMRLRLPDGFTIQPHTHPNFERVTVLSGVFLLGHGAEFDEQETDRLEAGSFTTMPPDTEHFAIIEGDTVLQLTSIGPWDIQYVDPADDPRQQ